MELPALGKFLRILLPPIGYHRMLRTMKFDCWFWDVWFQRIEQCWTFPSDQQNFCHLVTLHIKEFYKGIVAWHVSIIFNSIYIYICMYIFPYIYNILYICIYPYIYIIHSLPLLRPVKISTSAMIWQVLHRVPASPPCEFIPNTIQRTFAGSQAGCGLAWDVGSVISGVSKFGIIWAPQSGWFMIYKGKSYKMS